MKKTELFRRVLVLLLVVTMLAGYALPAGAVGADNELRFELEQIDNSAVTAERPMQQMGTLDQESMLSGVGEAYPNEIVRVSIQLEKAATIDAGFQLMGIGSNAAAMHYRDGLEQTQKDLTASIERHVLNGQKLDVVWNLTLAANIISANVPRGAIEKIAAMDGIRAVVEETRYEPQVVSMGGAYSPNMATSGQMTGAAQLWDSGYTGAGKRIAIIDTGLDTDHQSFDAAAFDYALGVAAQANGINYSDQLLDTDEIASVLEELNIYARAAENGETLTAEDLYINTKAPYGYNYADGGLDVTHDNDSSGEHGSHVAGIAAANRYLEQDGAYVDAMQEVYVAGNAPDAQLLTMKVFGSEGGAYDADIMAAIEDALLLGADAINLSLGSSLAGRTYCDESVYQELFDRLENTDTVVSISAGNYGYWAENTYYGDLFSDDVNFATGGSPGTYANSFAVASVDNDGSISGGLMVGGKSFGYTEELTDGYTAFGNAPLANLDTSADKTGTDYGFIFTDGYGAAADFEGVELTNKVVFLSRGDLSFVEKANNAASLGAAAVVVYDNQPGLLFMDLTGYKYTAPVVGITMGQGALVKAAAQAQTTDAGLTYYTGTVTVVGTVSGHYNESEFKTMSSFSSWGVPSDLVLKPEITAPGGNIYSVNGLDTSGTGYELMSGTSMAAPQVAGMSALLLQYVQENGLEADGLTDRALVHALLMSTAQPLRNAENGGYYAVMQQGSGLANVADAMTTPVYITVDGMDDGKVKAELGDDADRTGTYSFSFKLNNLSDEMVPYQLSADVFTQDVFTDEDGIGYLDTLTRAMDAEAVFAVDGKVLDAPARELLDCDYNGDGKVTLGDGELLLEHATIGTALAANADHADLNGDGLVNTYDSHLFLKLYRSTVEVPANGSVTVEATLALTDAEKALLAQENPAGAYVQAFVIADPLTTAEGAKLPALSIPVLGYYGGWHEPSMFDETCYTTYFTGEENREPYWATSYVNGVGVIYGDDQNVTYYFGGNPITADDVYRPERNAINLERGDYFRGWDFGLIRNAGAHCATIVNTTTGEELFYEEGGAVDAAYYSASLGGWLNVPQTFELNFAPDMVEGERGTLTFSAVVELYGSDWTKADTMEMPFVVDNTAPVVADDSIVVDTENNVLRLTASDNQHVAGVCIYDVTGRKLLASCGADQNAQPGETVTLEVPLENVDGYKFVIQVVDYAVNKTTYKLKQTIGDPEPLPEMLYYSTTFHEWEVGDWPETNTELVSYDGWFESDLDVMAATAVGSYVYFTDGDNNLYAAPGDNLFEYGKVCTLEHKLADMTYDRENGIIYAIYSYDNYDSMLISIDRMTGAVTEIGKVAAGYYPGATLAYVGDDQFYMSSDQNYPNLYTFTLSEGQIGSVSMVGYFNPYSSGYDCLEYNPKDGMLYFVCNNSYSSSTQAYELNKIDPKNPTNGSYVKSDYRYFYGEVTSLIFPDWSDEANAWFDPNGKVSGITLNKTKAEVFVGKSFQLTASVSPWNVQDRGVVFSSSDDAVATVTDDGLVTGVGPGSAVITAASTSNPDITAQCTVTVSVLDITVEGILVQDAGTEDVTNFFTWDALSGENWVAGAQLAQDAIAAAPVPGSDNFFILNPGNATYELDADGKVVSGPYTYMPDNYYKPHGLAYSQQFSTEQTPWVYYIRNGSLMYPRAIDSTASVSNFSMGYDHDYLVAIASAGTEKYVNGSTEYDSDILYLVDDIGMVWKANVYMMDYGWAQYYYCKYVKTPSTLPSDLFADKSYSSMVLGDDGALYLSAFTGKSNKLYRLAYNADDGIYEAMDLGDFGEDVWPAIVMKVTSNAPAITQPPLATLDAVTELAEPSVSEAAGGLQAIKVSDENAVVDNGTIVTDCGKGTVTVPVYALDSSNGLFELTYDSEKLTLESVEAGGVMTCVDTAAEGVVRVGYADADVVNAMVAKLVFRVNTENAEQTALILTTHEDCNQLPGTRETMTLEIPGHSFGQWVITTDPTCTESGVETRTCACGETETRPVAALGHDWVGTDCDRCDATRENPFVDVTKDAWFFEAALELYHTGIIKGVDATHFYPDGTLTRAHWVTMLYRAAGSPAAEEPCTFTDVPEGAYYADAFAWAEDAGIVIGIGGGLGAPEAEITREEMVTTLYRYDGQNPATADLSAFSDAGDISGYASDAFVWAVSKGYIKGVTNSTLAPQSTATRAQAATMLSRYLGLI